MGRRPGIRHWTIGAAVLAAAAFLCVAQAQQGPVPSTVNYQGTLHKTDGKTAETGPVDLEFRLYMNKGDDKTAAVWAETHTAQELFKGIFNVLLGSGGSVTGLPHDSLDSVFTQAALWLGLQVQGEADERGERQQLTSVPYALTANTAVNALHGVPAGTIAIWGAPEADIPVDSGWLPCDGRELDVTEDSGKYKALWNAIGTAWGSSGAGKFNLPNFGGRALMGENASHSLGDRLGEEEHALDDYEMGSHDHTFVDTYSIGAVRVSGQIGLPQPYYWHLPREEDYDGDWRPTGYTGGKAEGFFPHATKAHANMQPSRVVAFIIKY
ncbi:MAG TPA: tail fiber protein [Candidatus Bathyarchaeia archaeon]|nr:tail fiber protein [Candidatus Bathyarchaeia archaeon]